MKKIRSFSENVIYLTGTILLFVALFQGISILHLKKQAMLTPPWVVYILLFFMLLAAIMDIIDPFYSSKDARAKWGGINTIVEGAFIVALVCNIVIAL